MTDLRWYDLLIQQPVSTSAPCRIDMGGTLDISIFYYPLRYLKPCTFNLALAMRTRVTLVPYKAGWVKVSSKGFEPATFALDELPFQHPLGLIFAIAAYYRAGGVHIQIESASPVRSALGGSSVAAVALITAFEILRERSGEKRLSRQAIAMLAHSLEQSVAGVPCGVQDMLAAAFGGVHAWYWDGGPGRALYTKRKLAYAKEHSGLRRRMLVAYCGAPHESQDVNGQWVRQFLSGQFRSHWAEIVQATQTFIRSFESRDFNAAAEAMNHETDLRCEMTPQVLDDTGHRLVAVARENGCGARFTGAGGGGCVWALGEPTKIELLRPGWQSILDHNPEACLLDPTVDPHGVL